MDDYALVLNRSKVSAWVIPTNEELMIARHKGALLGLAKAATESR